MWPWKTAPLPTASPPKRELKVGDVVKGMRRPLFNFYLDKNYRVGVIDPVSHKVLVILPLREMHSLVLKGLGMIPTEVAELRDLLVADGYDDDEACAIAWVIYNAGYRKIDEDRS